MSSTSVAAVPIRPAADILEMSFGKASPVSLQVQYQEFDASQPGPAELRLAFQMLDALLLTTPFDQWEN